MDQLEQATPWDRTNPNGSPWEPVDHGTGEVGVAVSRFEGVIWPATTGGIDITSLAGFVDHLLHDSERADPSRWWCEEWWRHPEAILIFHALRKSMPRAEKDLNNWLMHDLVPQLNHLFGEEGPFRSCKPGQHKYKNTPTTGIPTHGYHTDEPCPEPAGCSNPQQSRGHPSPRGIQWGISCAVLGPRDSGS